jgi:hypothetical protein
MDTHLNWRYFLVVGDRQPKRCRHIHSSPNSRIVFAATVTMSKNDDIATRSIFKSDALNVLPHNAHDTRATST